jgi:hypothetical protein
MVLHWGNGTSIHEAERRADYTLTLLGFATGSLWLVRFCFLAVQAIKVAGNFSQWFADISNYEENEKQPKTELNWCNAG